MNEGSHFCDKEKQKFNYGFPFPCPLNMADQGVGAANIKCSFGINSIFEHKPPLALISLVEFLSSLHAAGIVYMQTIKLIEYRIK